MSRVRYGVSLSLEEKADALLKESLRGVTRHADKADILTPWKLQERYRREVYVASGTPDAQLRRGVFHRVLNRQSPHLNARDGIAAPRRAGTSDSLSDHVTAGNWSPGIPSAAFDDAGDS